MDKIDRLTKRFGGNQANDRFGKDPSMKKGCFIDGLLSQPVALGATRTVFRHGRLSQDDLVRDGIVRPCKVSFGLFAIVR